VGALREALELPPPPSPPLGDPGVVLSPLVTPEVSGDAADGADSEVSAVAVPELPGAELPGPAPPEFVSDVGLGAGATSVGVDFGAEMVGDDDSGEDEGAGVDGASEAGPAAAAASATSATAVPAESTGLLVAGSGRAPVAVAVGGVLPTDPRSASAVVPGNPPARIQQTSVAMIATE
jgi:hypothetical protein